MQLILGNCLEKLKELKDNSVDSVVTDPPYGISFMGKKWDYDVPSKEIWTEVLRVLKPGGHALVACGTRTQHRMAVNIEDAGFEIRDMIAWVYGSGFPKSLNIGKAVDKLQGNEREVLGEKETKDFSHHKGSMMGKETTPDDKTQTTTITETKGTSQWEGWGTALKPAMELWTLCRKPLSEPTVAENCLKWGVGGINIDGCRVGTTEQDKYDLEQRQISKGSGVETNINFTGRDLDLKHGVQELGRFPANLIHDGSDEVVGLFPNSKSAGEYKKDKLNTFIPEEAMFPLGYQTNAYAGESGSASRFFYCAKASKAERNIGCEGLEKKVGVGNFMAEAKWINDPRSPNGGYEAAPSKPQSNSHPTVKPLALMEYLVKLVSREGQVVLDPFMGSGTTGMACKKLDREFIGIEMMPEYMEIAKRRIGGVKKEDQLNMI